MRLLILLLGMVLIAVKCSGQKSHYDVGYQYWRPEDQAIAPRQFSPDPPLRRQAVAAFANAIPAFLFSVAGVR